jgi:hypothetical protein
MAVPSGCMARCCTPASKQLRYGSRPRWLLCIPRL